MKMDTKTFDYCLEEYLGISHVTPKLIPPIPIHTRPHVSPSQNAIIVPLLRLQAFYLSRQYPDKAKWIQRIINTIVALFVACLFCVHVDAQTAEQITLFREFEHLYRLPEGILDSLAWEESQHGALLSILSNHAPGEKCDRRQFAALQHIAALTSTRVTDYRVNYMCAIGLMQWRPVSWQEWAQDGDGDGLRDPRNDADAVATTAYFLAVRIQQVGIRRALKHFTGDADYAQRVAVQYSHADMTAQITIAE